MSDESSFLEKLRDGMVACCSTECGGAGRTEEGVVICGEGIEAGSPPVAPVDGCAAGAVRYLNGVEVVCACSEGPGTSFEMALFLGVDVECFEACINENPSLAAACPSLDMVAPIAGSCCNNCMGTYLPLSFCAGGDLSENR